MGVPDADWLALAPVLLPASGAVLVLAVDAMVGVGARSGWRRSLLDGVALAAVLAALITLVPLARGTRATLCSTADRCSYVAGHLTFSFQVVVLVAALATLLLALAERTRAERTRAEPPHTELPHAELLVLLLAATAGAAALPGARDWGTFAVALETASLPIVGLVALRQDRRGAEGALKLLLTAVLSFGLLALGIALLYGATGSLYLGVSVSGELGDLRVVHGLGLALVVAGASFKLSLVPFHLWTPETYASAPLPVAAFLSTVSKAAGLAAVVVALAIGAPGRGVLWAMPIGLLAVVTMSVGNLVALRQVTAVRLLAWSTVAQAGWVLLPLAGVTDSGRLGGAVAASLGYLLAYVTGTLAVFAVVAVVAADHPQGAQHPLTAYRGFWRREPALALALAFGLLCLAGLPPGVMGLVAKILALVPIISTGAWALVAVAVLNVVLGVAVYLRWVAYLFASEQAAAVPSTSRRTPLAGRLALSLAAAGCVALSVLPEGLIGLLGGSALR